MNCIETPHTSAYDNLGIYEKPFELIPDYRYLYLPTKRLIALDNIMELIESRASDLMITGESGSGKTSLARRIEFKLSNFRNHYPMFIDVNKKLHSDEFWKILVKHFNLRISQRPEKNQKTLLDFLELNIVNVYFDLIIDNVELTNIEFDNTLMELDDFRKYGIRLFQLILFKTTQEAPIINNNSLPNFRLAPFDFYETRKMIEYRLFICGLPKIFSEKAIEKLYEISGGNPRRVVNCCRVSLEYISQNGKSFIDEDDIESVIQLMNLTPKKN